MRAIWRPFPLLYGGDTAKVVGDAPIHRLDQEQMRLVLSRWHQTATGNALAEHFRVDVDEVYR